MVAAIVTPMADRTFAKFTMFKIDPAWRRNSAEQRAEDKREFLAACEDFATDRSLRAYSTIGTRGDVDIVLLSQSPNLDDLHTFHVVLGQSGLAKWADTPYSFLSMTKKSPYSEEGARPEICVSERRPRRPGVRRRLRGRRPRRVPRPGPGAAPDRVERLHRE
jgi:chlorite dismutase